MTFWTISKGHVWKSLMRNEHCLPSQMGNSWTVFMFEKRDRCEMCSTQTASVGPLEPLSLSLKSIHDEMMRLSSADGSMWTNDARVQQSWEWKCIQISFKKIGCVGLKNHHQRKIVNLQRRKKWGSITNHHERLVAQCLLSGVECCWHQDLLVGQSDLSIQSQSHIEPHSRERSSAHRCRNIDV